MKPLTQFIVVLSMPVGYEEGIVEAEDWEGVKEFLAEEYPHALMESITKVPTKKL